MDIDLIVKSPKPYEAYGTGIWTDAHISGEMLKAHLDEETDAASYRPQTRAAIIGYLCGEMRLGPGAKLLDLGCGPGLYAHAFAQRGLQVAAVDISTNSIAYARERAQREGLSIDYRVANYCDDMDFEGFDAAVMISKDYGVLGPADRQKLLRNVFRALRPAGGFALDLCADAQFEALAEGMRWSAQPLGFWRPHPHIVLERTLIYRAERAWCDLYAVIDQKTSVYTVYQTAFTPRRIEGELGREGFAVLRTLGSLDGAPLDAHASGLAVIAGKRL